MSTANQPGPHRENTNPCLEVALALLEEAMGELRILTPKPGIQLADLLIISCAFFDPGKTWLLSAPLLRV